MPSIDTFAGQQIRKLAEKHRIRQLKSHFQADSLYVEEGNTRLVSFASNDYLALSHHPEVISAGKAALAEYGAGATASRLVAGNYPLYARLEAALAEYKGFGAALVIGSGYLTSLGVIPALAGRGDLILADKLAHACMIDGAKLSGAALRRFKHNDLEDLEALLESYRGKYENCLILTEHVFSMDGDLAPLAEMKALAEKYDAWLLSDDAHSLIPANAKPHIQIGTLSKSLGSYGGYVAASRQVVDYLQSSARSLIFSTGLPPAAVGAALKSLEIAKAEPERARKAIENAAYFTGKPHYSSVVPHIIGGAERAVKAMEKLKKAGFFVLAIRPPTVPQGTARLRFSFTAAHEKSHIDAVLKALSK